MHQPLQAPQRVAAAEADSNGGLRAAAAATTSSSSSGGGGGGTNDGVAAPPETEEAHAATDTETLLSFVDKCFEEHPLVEPFDLSHDVELKLSNCARVLEMLANSCYPPKIWKCFEKKVETNTASDFHTASDFQPLSKPHVAYARNL